MINVINKCVDYVINNEKKLSNLIINNNYIIDIDDLECKNVDMDYILYLFNNIFRNMVINVYAKKFNDEKFCIVKRIKERRKIEKIDYETIDEYYENRKKRCEERETIKNDKILACEEKEVIKNDIESKWLKENNYKNIEEYYKKRDLNLKRSIDNHKYVPDYKKGELDPNSSTGFAFISQRVVSKTLGLDISNDCNCELGFGAEYDLYDKNKYELINVKACTSYKNGSWYFGLKNKYEPDNYIFVGFTKYKKDILHVWIIPSYILSDDISVYISNKSLSRFKIYEVDVDPYNKVYHNMSIKNCKVLKSDC